MIHRTARVGVALYKPPSMFETLAIHRAAETERRRHKVASAHQRAMIQERMLLNRLGCELGPCQEPIN